MTFKMKIFRKTYECGIRLHKYVHCNTNALGIVLMHKRDKTEEETIISTNITEMIIEEDEVIIPTYKYEEFYNKLKELKLIEDKLLFKYNYGIFKVCKLTPLAKDYIID